MKQNASKNYSEDVTIAVVPEITIILSLKKKKILPHIIIYESNIIRANIFLHYDIPF